jgi:hypothetical protein
MLDMSFHPLRRGLHSFSSMNIGERPAFALQLLMVGFMLGNHLELIGYQKYLQCAWTSAISAN